MRAIATPSNAIREVRNKGPNPQHSLPSSHNANDTLPTSIQNKVWKLKTRENGLAPPLSLVLSSLDTGYLEIDRNYVIRDVNSVALKWLGMQSSDVVGLPFATLSPKSPMQMLQNAIEGEIFTDREQPSYERPDRWMEYHVYPAKMGAIIFFRDLTDKKIMERNAARTKLLLQASLDALSAHIVILDRDGTIIASNLAWQRFAVTYGLVGVPADRPLNYLALYAEPLARRPEAGRIGEALRSVLTGRRRTVRLVYASQLSGNAHWFQLSVTRFSCGGETYLLVANEDVTATKEAQQALGEVAEQLLALQEDERQRISRELHDSTMQHLVAMGLSLMGLRAEPGTSEAAHGLLNEMERSLDEASRELRSFTYLLHPPRLEESGLHMSLRQYVDGFGKRTGIATKLRADPSLDILPFALQKSVFRIVQEALANVHRHAAASRVSIDLRCVFAQLHLIISDNGCGIGGNARIARPPPARPLRVGVGLPGITARLRQFGGELDVRSGPGGTRLHAVVPLGLEGPGPAAVAHSDGPQPS